MDRIDYDKRANRRMEIDKNRKLKVHLQDWDDQRKEELLKIEGYRGRCNAIKTEMYQLIGFFIIFQGVVFSAVAGKNRLTCHTSSIPASLSFLTTVAIYITVRYKLAYYNTQELKLLKAQCLVQNIEGRIFMLKQDGLEFDFLNINDHKEGDMGKEAKESHTCLYWFLTFFLWAFFSGICFSCFFILCRRNE